MRRLLLAALALAAGGCSYYNGMYNANRLAGQAAKAEREGRPFDARSYWGQAVVKAESVVARHPTSKWVDDALLLQGRGYVHLGQCQNATAPLEAARLRLPEPARREEAIYLLARCRMETGDTIGAGRAFADVLGSADAERRREARYGLAVARIHAGEYGEAVALLDSIEDWRATGQRAVALAALGRTAEAVTSADSLVARGDTLAPWAAVLRHLAAHDALAADSLLDRLRAMPKVTPGAQVPWIAAVVEPLAAVDPARAEARTGALDSLGASDMVARARFVRLRALAARTADPAQLRALGDSLAELGAEAGVLEARPVAGAARQVAAALDSVAAGAPEGDLAVFFAGEAARDRLAAPAMAHALFVRVLEGWPASPYAGKALLAARGLDPTWAQANQALVDERYRDSPYVAALHGGDPAVVRPLEDSLATWALRHPASDGPAGAPGDAAPAAVRDDRPAGEKDRGRAAPAQPRGARPRGVRPVE